MEEFLKHTVAGIVFVFGEASVDHYFAMRVGNTIHSVTSFERQPSLHAFKCCTKAIRFTLTFILAVQI